MWEPDSHPSCSMVFLGGESPHLPIYAQVTFRNRMKKYSEGQSLLEAGVVRGSAGVVSGPTWTSKGRSQRALSQGSFQIQLLLRLWPPCWRTGCSLWVSWRTLPTGQARLGLSLFFSGGAFEHYESGHLGSNHFLKPITL